MYETIACRAAQVRALEERAYRFVPPGSLMQKVAVAIATTGAGVLRERRGGVYGARVVLLVGTGDNGGDALFAGAGLARRGAQVHGLVVGERVHEAGLAALKAAGGRAQDATSGSARARIQTADLIIDGIVGIGGSGPLRAPAADLAALVNDADGYVIAVDLPSGVDCDTGAVAHPEHTVIADLTVTSGCLKPALIVMPAALYAGDIEVVDIGLDIGLAEVEESLIRVDERFAAQFLQRPSALDDKFSRGVVGVASGAPAYRGAAVLSTGGARAGISGFVRYAGRSTHEVTRAWPDVVCTDSISTAGRVQCWVVGPGLGTDDIARAEVSAALRADVPLVLDADALTLLAADEHLRELCRSRVASTVLTPHRGEFERLAGRSLDEDPIAHLTALSSALGATILLKGATTLIAGKSGPAYVVASGPAELGTAGSGDVLAGLMGSLIASAEVATPHVGDDAIGAAAVAAYVHGIAGQLATADGHTITSADVLEHVPAAIGLIRRSSEVADGVDARS